jgi:tetratricopeptide (TPR) repeat protein
MIFRTFGRGSGSRAEKRYQRALDLIKKGKQQKALSSLEELHGELTANGVESALALNVEFMLAFGYWAVGREDEGMRLARHGYETHRDPFHKGRLARLLGISQLTSGRLDEGILLFEESLELMEEADPLASETTRHTLDLAALYRDKERWAEVAALLEKVLKGYRLGAIRAAVDNYDVFQVRWSLAIAYWHERRFDDAREQLVLFRGYEPLFARHPVLRQTVGQAAAIVNYVDLHAPNALSDVTLEDIVGVVRDDWRYQGLMYKGPLSDRGWGGGSGR